MECFPIPNSPTAILWVSISGARSGVSKMHAPESRNTAGTLLEPQLEPCWNLAPCNPGNLQLWNLGTVQNLGTLPDNIAALEPWNLLLGCKAGLI